MAEDQNTSWLRRAIQEIVAANDAATREIAMSGGTLPALSRGVVGAVDDASMGLTGAPLLISRPAAPTQQAAPAPQSPPLRRAAPSGGSPVEQIKRNDPESMVRELLMLGAKSSAAPADVYVGVGDNVTSLANQRGEMGNKSGKGSFSRASIKGAKNSAQKNLTGFDANSFAGIGLPPQIMEALGTQASQAASSSGVAPFAEMIKAILGSQTNSPLNANTSTPQQQALSKNAEALSGAGNMAGAAQLLSLLFSGMSPEEISKALAELAQPKRR